MSRLRAALPLASIFLIALTVRLIAVHTTSDGETYFGKYWALGEELRASHLITDRPFSYAPIYCYFHRPGPARARRGRLRCSSCRSRRSDRAAFGAASPDSRLRADRWCGGEFRTQRMARRCRWSRSGRDGRPCRATPTARCGGDPIPRGGPWARPRGLGFKSSIPRSVDQEGFRTQLALVLLAGVFASVVAVGAAAVAAFHRAVGPELSNRTRLIGVIVRAEVQRAAEAGIPLNSIAGLDRYLSVTLEKFREVERISVSTSSGQSVAVAERLDAAPILPRAEASEAYAARQTAFVLPVIDGNTTT